ncbi:MAG: hypothetical protein KGL18_01180 [Burkholderiales bacterium]|nr:hypothetical protein [Burkholderiales bacterium]MDE1928215.1 hypothetical protein [Burkholderiales bacterium]MDE2157450.1 hypothetical protein [Burkholderiales bacterium]MDE2501576.1 hypothetical protein [Burkholderiales bacterium]
MLAALLAGCGQDRASADWFPLAAGHRWTYRVTTTGGDDGDTRETQVMTTLGREDIAGGAAWRRRSDSGIDYWLRVEPGGIYRVASKNDLQADPVPDQPPRPVLLAPYRVGTQWQADTTAYLLMRRNEFPREIRYTHPRIPMSYRIEAVDDHVETPAGSFAPCLRVRGTAAVRLYADPVSGWTDLPLVTLEWYCRGVGLVRVERTESAHSSFLTGGKRTLDLVDWK